LMMAPTGMNGSPAANTPISNWTIVDGFDTAAACTDAQQRLVSGGRGTQRLTRFRSQSACVATDDPRLMPTWGPNLLYRLPLH
jgi:hypothetical protein